MRRSMLPSPTSHTSSTGDSELMYMDTSQPMLSPPARLLSLSPPPPSAAEDTMSEDDMEIDHELPNHPEENSLLDDTPADISLDNTDCDVVTYQIVRSGTQRGKPKLVDCLGYSYNIKRTQKCKH